MTLCEDGHDQICFDDSRQSCPLCEARKEIEQWEKEGKENEEKIEDLEGKISDLEVDIEDLQKEEK